MQLKNCLIGGQPEFKKSIKNPDILSNLCDGIYTSSGRSAFQLILNELKKKKIQDLYMPRLICPSVIRVAKKNRFNIISYSVNSNFEPVLKNLKANSSTLFVQFFGLKIKFKN